MSKSYREMEAEMKEQEIQEQRQSSKYQRECKGVTIDVYDILHSFKTNNPAIDHAVKKLLAGGKRGYKDTIQDYIEAIESITRGIELER